MALPTRNRLSLSAGLLLGQGNLLNGIVDPCWIISEIMLYSNDTSCMFSYMSYAYDKVFITIDEYYLWWVLAPLFCTVFLPFLIFAIFYIDIVIIVIYTWHWGEIINAYGTSLYNGALATIAAIWDAHSRLWHGYEIVGMENVPTEGPALLVFYHGALPVDCYYLISRIYLEKSRLPYTVVDKFLFNLPGFATFAKGTNILPGTLQQCVSILKKGGLLVVAPGGVYEAQFGDSNYELLWKSRAGFAKVVLESKAPVIPVFTQNIRQALVSMHVGKSIWMKLYSWTRLPLVPILGSFPVKMRTFVGKPVPYDSSTTPEQLKLEVQTAMSELISRNQKIPHSIFQAILDRFRNSQHIS